MFYTMGDHTVVTLRDLIAKNRRLAREAEIGGDGWVIIDALGATVQYGFLDCGFVNLLDVVA